MNKSVIALAVLGAFAGAAAAQSSVTLYGRADANITYSDRGSILDGNSRTSLYDGGANSGIGGSRFGLRGVEDLGDGLKAFFLLESGFNIDTGGQENANSGSAANPQRLFSRLAYVGLSSSNLGEIRLGRQESISRQMNAIGDVSTLGELKTDETVIIGSATDRTVASSGAQLFQTFGQRIDNSAVYISPSFSGLQLQAMVAAGEGTQPRYQGAMLTYKSGPIVIGLSYDEQAEFGTAAANPISADGSFNKTIAIAGSYDFGIAKVHAGFQDVSDVANAYSAGTTVAGTAVGNVEDQQAYTVGVMVPFGNWQFRATYINADYDIVGGGSEDIQKYGVSARYAFSKRTTAYAAVTARTGSGNVSDSASTLRRYNEDWFAQKNEFTVGIAHTF